MKHVVIVGGGFGGVAALRHLVSNPNLKITLVTDSPFFKYAPALYRVATGYWREQAIMNMEDILPSSKNLEIIYAKAETIDRDLRRIRTSKGHVLEYDYAILSLGVVTSYFGITGLEKFAYGIKSNNDIKKLHDHLHHQLVATHKPDTNYIIVGGGPTGVELAASLISYLKYLAVQHHVKADHIKVEIIEAAPRLLPSLSPRVSNLAYKKLRKIGVKILLNSKVEAETAKSLTVQGRSIPTKTVVWTAGVVNNPFFSKNAEQFSLNEHGRVNVDEFLRVDKQLFVIGDNANTRYSGLAQVAVLEGQYVAKIINNIFRARPTKPFKHSPPAYVVPVGHYWAVMEWRKFITAGFIASNVRRAADLIGYADIMGSLKALMLWLRVDKKQESCQLCADPKV